MNVPALIFTNVIVDVDPTSAGELGITTLAVASTAGCAGLEMPLVMVVPRFWRPDLVFCQQKIHRPDAACGDNDLPGHNFLL